MTLFESQVADLQARVSDIQVRWIDDARKMAARVVEFQAIRRKLHLIAGALVRAGSDPVAVRSELYHLAEVFNYPDGSSFLAGAVDLLCEAADAGAEGRPLPEDANALALVKPFLDSFRLSMVGPDMPPGVADDQVRVWQDAFLSALAESPT